MTADNRCVTAIVVGMTSTGIIDADSGLIDERVILHVRCSSSHFYKVMAKYGKTKAFYSIKPILIAA
jgi:hypothetical protein